MYRNEIGSQRLSFDKDLLTWLLMRSIANSIMKSFNREYLTTFVANEEKGKIELITRYADNDIYNYFEPKILNFVNDISFELKELIKYDIINIINIDFMQTNNNGNDTIIRLTMGK